MNWETEEIVRIIINDQALYRAAREKIQSLFRASYGTNVPELIRLYAETDDGEVKDAILRASGLKSEAKGIASDFKAWIIDSVSLLPESNKEYDLVDLDYADMLEVVAQVIA